MLKTFVSLANSWNYEEALKQSRDHALKQFLQNHNCSTIEQLNQLGAEGKLLIDYPVADWTRLKWRVEDLLQRRAIPAGSMMSNKDKVLLYVIPPCAEDANLYSIHCKIPAADKSANLDGVQKIKRLLECNWLTGMNNGVRDFNLGESDDCFGWHYGADKRLAEMKLYLQ